MAPLVKEGVLVQRSGEKLQADIEAGYIWVVEREQRLLAGVRMCVLGPAPDGVLVAEIGAFFVLP